MAGNRWMRVYSLVEYGLLALIKTTSSTIQHYTNVTVASSTGINGQSRRHWSQQQDSQEDGTLLHRRYLDTADTWLKVLFRTAKLSSPGSTWTSNHSFLQHSFLALGKVQSLYLVTLHNRPQEQHSIHRQRRELRIMDG
jgi:hypothetical protein